MRYFSLTLGLLLVVSGAAFGQVAAPSLNPFLLGDTAKNPAALQWSDASHISAAIINGDQTAETGGLVDPANEGDIEGTFVQARAVGEFFSAGVEIANVDFTLGNSTVGTTDEELELSQVALALRIGDSLAVFAQIGVGGHDAGDRRARRLAHHAAAIVLRDHCFQHVVDRFGDRHVDDLALAAALSLDDRQQDAESGVEAV